jgi:hypothetical protein
MRKRVVFINFDFEHFLSFMSFGSVAKKQLFSAVQNASTAAAAGAAAGAARQQGR